jgi:hypothetical protein
MQAFSCVPPDLAHHQRPGKNGREEDRMELKWIAMAALAAALIPAAAAAQAKTSADSNASRRSTSDSSTSRDTVTSTSTGDVSSSRQGSSATSEMLKAQQDPNIIGSPAWWKSHGTADGKPISGPPKD